MGVWLLYRRAGVLESRTRDRVLHVVSRAGPGQQHRPRRAPRPHRDRRAPPSRRTCGRRPRRAPRGHRPAAAGAARQVVVLSRPLATARWSDYDHLAGEALRFLADAAGAEAVHQFAEHRVAEPESSGIRSRSTPRATTPPTARRPSSTRSPPTATRQRPHRGPARPPTQLTGIQLCQGHCPVQHVAAEFPQFCDAETEAFSRLLGVHVQRLATLAHGDHVCTTFIPTHPTPTSPRPTTRKGQPDDAPTSKSSTRV